MILKRLTLVKILVAHYYCSYRVLIHYESVLLKRGTLRGIIRHEHVDYRCDGPLATVTLDNPELDDRMRAAMAEELGDICRAIAQDDSVRLVIITGKGGVFSVGRPTLSDGRDSPGTDGPLGWIYQHQMASTVA